MRPAIYVAAIGFCAATAPELTRAALASACAVLLESLPYLCASAILERVSARFARPALAYLGCGCGQGASARSLPATAAAWMLFGPWVALARWVAAIFVSFRTRANVQHETHGAPLAADLAVLAPPALLCGMLVTFAPMLDLAHRSPLAQLAAGAVLGFAAAPCALGGVALAAALRVQSPLACAAVLAIAGIADLRVWFPTPHVRVAADRATYAFLAGACAIVAYQHGAALVHPHLTLALWFACACCALFAYRFPPAAHTSQRALALGALVLCVLGSPPPPESATEATYDDAYAGERIDFTGRYEEHDGFAQLVRYSITCCRADARPIGVRLSQRIARRSGTWLRARGVLHETNGGLELAPAAISPVEPPGDPFIYR